ncbi:MAG: helix-turn-helix domain-containing protein [Desulfomonile tiedjei]|nr:helix-turn-helix domain-containing protein [Desulfomonile tiedjei]
MGEEEKLSSDAFEWAYNEFVGNDPESMALFKEYEVKADIGQQVYDLRTRSGMTQAQLAELVGIAESVIHDLEEADYEGDSLTMLVRIASVLNQKIEVRFVPSTSNEAREVSEFGGTDC